MTRVTDRGSLPHERGCGDVLVEQLYEMFTTGSLIEGIMPHIPISPPSSLHSPVALRTLQEREVVVTAFDIYQSTYL